MGKKGKDKRKKTQQEEDNNDQDDIMKESDQEQENTSLIKEENRSTDNYQKRTNSDNDSDAEIAPKRKKKKKQATSTDQTDKKGKKSIRQMKREKHLQRQAESEAAAKDQLKSQCLNYLSQWKHDKSNWKFMKAKQVWLTKNKFNVRLVPNESWPVLLEYFQSAKGNIHNTLLEDAKKIINQMDEWTEKHKEDNNGDEEEETSKPDETTYKRARDLIQSLQ